MKYLVFPTAKEAGTRSWQAYNAVTCVNSSTKYLWAVRECAGGYAVCIPDTPSASGIPFGQAEYDALLTEDERNRLVSELTFPEME